MDNDIERLKAYHHIESFIDIETQNFLKKKLDLENSNLDKRLPGLQVEDEFALILYFLDNCKHIVSLDETTSILTDKSYQSDFILHFKNNNTMMVEVKSTENNKFKISKNNFLKRKQFAKDLGYELFFALKINGVWMFFHNEYFEKNNYTIELKKDMLYSSFYNVMDSTVYIIPKNLRIESLYNIIPGNGIGIIHEEYGELISYKLYYNEVQIFEITSDNKEYLPHCLVFELWHDLLAESIMITKLDEYHVLLIEETKEELLTLDFRYFLSSISHIHNNHYDRYNSSSFLKLIASNKNISLKKIVLEKLFNDLISLGIPIVFAKFQNSDHLEFI